MLLLVVIIVNCCLVLLRIVFLLSCTYSKLYKEKTFVNKSQLSPKIREEKWVMSYIIERKFNRNHFKFGM